MFFSQQRVGVRQRALWTQTLDVATCWPRPLQTPSSLTSRGIFNLKTLSTVGAPAEPPDLHWGWCFIFAIYKSEKEINQSRIITSFTYSHLIYCHCFTWETAQALRAVNLLYRCLRQLLRQLIPSIWTIRISSLAFLWQERQRCRGGELWERSGTAAGGRAQAGGADEAQTGAWQNMHGEATLEEHHSILCVLKYFYEPLLLLCSYTGDVAAVTVWVQVTW